MSYDYRIGRECVEHALGKEWTFSRFTRKVWVDLAQEAKRLMPNPIAVALDAIEAATATDVRVVTDLRIKDAAELGKAAAERRQPVLLADAYYPVSTAITDRAFAAAKRYLSAGSPEMSEFLNSHEGASYLFFLLLKPKHPDVTLEDAYDVYWDLGTNAGADGRKTVWEILGVCNGKSAVPPKNADSPA